MKNTLLTTGFTKGEDYFNSNEWFNLVNAALDEVAVKDFETHEKNFSHYTGITEASRRDAAKAMNVSEKEQKSYPYLDVLKLGEDLPYKEPDISSYPDYNPYPLAAVKNSCVRVGPLFNGPFDTLAEGGGLGTVTPTTLEELRRGIIGGSIVMGVAGSGKIRSGIFKNFTIGNSGGRIILSASLVSWGRGAVSAFFGAAHAAAYYNIAYFVPGSSGARLLNRSRIQLYDLWAPFIGFSARDTNQTFFVSTAGWVAPNTVITVVVWAELYLGVGAFAGGTTYLKGSLQNLTLCVD